MNIALISCGPSASAFSASDHEGPIIAVSRKATQIRADIWAVFDVPVLLQSQTNVIGNPRLFTIHETLASLQHRQSKWANRAIVAESFECSVDHWHLFTAPACLVLAAAMGATRIDAWGVDMSGDGDSTGGAAGNPDVVRTESRWNRERAIWAGVEEWVKGKAVEVMRVSPTPA